MGCPLHVRGLDAHVLAARRASIHPRLGSRPSHGFMIFVSFAKPAHGDGPCIQHRCGQSDRVSAMPSWFLFLLQPIDLASASPGTQRQFDCFYHPAHYSIGDSYI